jgi:7,8-dihydropterin-6-yl-methyl-4-(beta-D-ribofuranosyl)aminobenzene 5'-phosphate synthase
MGVGEQLENSLEDFDRFKIDLIAVSHCTGNEAAAICYNRFKERFAFANAGWSTVF